MSVYGKNHYNIVISLQLIKINEKKKKKNPLVSTGDASLIPGSGRSTGVQNGNPFQCSCLENSMGRGAWWATVHGATNSWTEPSDYTHTHTHIHSAADFKLGLHFQFVFHFCYIFLNLHPKGQKTQSFSLLSIC